MASNNGSDARTPAAAGAPGALTAPCSVEEIAFTEEVLAAAGSGGQEGEGEPGQAAAQQIVDHAPGCSRPAACLELGIGPRHPAG